MHQVAQYYDYSDYTKKDINKITTSHKESELPFVEIHCIVKFSSLAITEKIDNYIKFDKSGSNLKNIFDERSIKDRIVDFLINIFGIIEEKIKKTTPTHFLSSNEKMSSENEILIQKNEEYLANIKKIKLNSDINDSQLVYIDDESLNVLGLNLDFEEIQLSPEWDYYDMIVSPDKYVEKDQNQDLEWDKAGLL